MNSRTLALLLATGIKSTSAFAFAPSSTAFAASHHLGVSAAAVSSSRSGEIFLYDFMNALDYHKGCM